MSCRVFALFYFTSICIRAAETSQVTFNRDIAPIVFQSCAGCHHPGGSGPFNLLTYDDVKKHAKQIAEVTARHYMPPWLPAGPRGEFLGDRRLEQSQIKLFQRWFEAGAPRGETAEARPPNLKDGWQLGTPDLVFKMTEKYILAAEGKDVYRNFVIPNPLGQKRNVRAVELNPGNRRIVHHAFIKVDGNGNARKLNGRDGQTGFAGMIVPEGVRMPKGYFLSWQPGKSASSEPPGYGWLLEPGQDIVLQTHLKPSGKEEVPPGGNWHLLHRCASHQPYCADFLNVTQYKHSSRRK